LKGNPDDVASETTVAGGRVQRAQPSEPGPAWTHRWQPELRRDHEHTLSARRFRFLAADSARVQAVVLKMTRVLLRWSVVCVLFLPPGPLPAAAQEVRTVLVLHSEQWQAPALGLLTQSLRESLAASPAIAV